MGGSIMFRTGSTWKRSSASFRAALAVIRDQHSLPDSANEYLDLATDFGFLALGDFPKDVREHFVEVMSTEEFGNELRVHLVDGLGFTVDGSNEGIQDLLVRARREPSFPDWLWSDHNNVIVKGLSMDHICDATGLQDGPVLNRDFDGGILKFDFTAADIDVYVDLAMVIPQTDETIDFTDARLRVQSRGVHRPEQLDALRSELLKHRNQFDQGGVA